jgi:hypothetical protein
MREYRAELVVGDLTDKGCVEAKCGGAGHAVCSRAAADLTSRSHCRIEVARFVSRQ